MISNYKDKKNKVLSMYEEYKKLFNETGEAISEKIKIQAENLKNDKFTLMVAGEAKSGKSTFINAYLGKEILPMDVKQCTSSLIEINYNENYELKVEYVEKPNRIFTKENDIVKFLRENAALLDEYRDIPTTVINEELLIKCKGDPSDRDIKNLIEGVKNDNIYGLSEKEFERKIKNYIKKEGPNWKSIVTKISVGWPLDENMKGITIIDSPGVNAEGMVGKITEKYIEQANAIMFVKSLNGQAVESTSFKKFLDAKSLDKHKDTIFLILTGTSNFSETEVNKLEAEANKIYNKIGKERIICVDSKIQLIANKCNEMKSENNITEYFSKMDAEKKSFPIAELTWFKTKNKKDFYELMLEKSNFTQVYNALEKFARKAQYLALEELLNSLEKAYYKSIDKLEELKNLYNEKLQDPKELEKQINAKKREIEEIKKKMNETIESIIEKYTNYDNGIIMKKCNEEIEDFDKKINFDSNHKTLDNLKNESFRKIDEFKDFREQLGRDLVNECNKKLIELTYENSIIKFTFLEPEFSEKDFNNIKENTKKDAIEAKYIEEGVTFKKTKKVPRYSSEKHFKIIKESILERLESIANTINNELQDYTINITQAYKEKLKENANSKKEEYDKLCNEKKNAEEIIKIIERFKNYIIKMNSNKKLVQAFKGGLYPNEQ